MRRTSPTGLKIIIGWEKLRLKPYYCPAGKLTIGYGHVILPGEDFSRGITIETAQELLRNDVAIAETAVAKYVSVELPQLCYDALVSFCYNVGCDNFRTSTLLKFLNSGDYYNAALEFCKWNIAGGQKLQGLINRRAEEELVFVAGAVGFIEFP